MTIKQDKWHSRRRLGAIVQDTSSPAGRAFALTVQVMIFASIVIFTVQTIPGLPFWLRRTLAWTEVGFVAVFTVEYLLRAYVSRPTKDYCLSFYGIIDLLSVLPFYLGVAGLHSLRILRLFRLVRVFKMTRYSAAMRRLFRAIRLVREELVLFALLAVIIMYLSSVGIYFFERNAQPDVFRSIPHSLWWAVVTLTTVGYGDAYPVTVGGKIFTGIVLMTALGIVSIPSGILASSLVEVRDEESLKSGDRGDGIEDASDTGC